MIALAAVIALVIARVQVAIGGDWLALVPLALVALCCGLPLLLLLLAGRRDRSPDGP